MVTSQKILVISMGYCGSKSVMLNSVGITVKEQRADGSCTNLK